MYPKSYSKLEYQSCLIIQCDPRHGFQLLEIIHQNIKTFQQFIIIADMLDHIARLLGETVFNQHVSRSNKHSLYLIESQLQYRQ